MRGASVCSIHRIAIQALYVGHAAVSRKFLACVYGTVCGRGHIKLLHGFFLNSPIFPNAQVQAKDKRMGIIYAKKTPNSFAEQQQQQSL